MSQGQDWSAPGTAQAYQPPSADQQPYAPPQASAPPQAYVPPQGNGDLPELGQVFAEAAMVPGMAFGTPGTPPAEVPDGMYFDQVSGLVLPDGTQVASVGRRIGSAFLAFPLAIVTLGFGYLIWGAITWSKGQTPTQTLLGLQTWRLQTGANTTWGEQGLREVSRVLYGIPFVGWIVALVSFFRFVSDPQHRSIHDQLGGTIVLYDPNRVLQPPAS